PGGEQFGADPLEPVWVIRIDLQLQHRTTMLERPGVRHVEKLCGPTPVVVAQDLTQLCGRPHVGQTLYAVGVGVQRGGEHAVDTQLVDDETGSLLSYPAGQR